MDVQGNEQPPEINAHDFGHGQYPGDDVAVKIIREQIHGPGHWKEPDPEKKQRRGRVGRVEGLVQFFKERGSPVFPETETPVIDQQNPRKRNRHFF